jgi:hypothetical protein
LGAGRLAESEKIANKPLFLLVISRLQAHVYHPFVSLPRGSETAHRHQWIVEHQPPGSLPAAVALPMLSTIRQRRRFDARMLIA